MALRTGIVAATLIAKHLCRTLTHFRPAINGVIAFAVTETTITSGQAATLASWLDGVQGACDILRAITHY
jgi:hypothetical protein